MIRTNRKGRSNVKLISFSKGGKDSYGVVVDGGIVDVGKKLGSKYPTLKDVIAAGALKEVGPRPRASSRTRSCRT